MSYESKPPLPIWFVVLALIVLFTGMSWYLGYMENQREIWAVEASKTPSEYAYNVVNFTKERIDLPMYQEDGIGAWIDIKAVSNKIQLFQTIGTEKEYELVKTIWYTNELFKQAMIEKAQICMYWSDVYFNPAKGVVVEFFITYGNSVKYNFILTPKDCGL